MPSNPFWNSQPQNVAEKPRRGTFPKVQRQQLKDVRITFVEITCQWSPESKCFEIRLTRHTPQFKAFLV